MAALATQLTPGSKNVYQIALGCVCPLGLNISGSAVFFDHLLHHAFDNITELAGIIQLLA